MSFDRIVDAEYYNKFFKSICKNVNICQNSTVFNGSVKYL